MKHRVLFLLLCIDSAICFADEQSQRLDSSALEPAVLSASHAIEAVTAHETELFKLRALAQNSKKSLSAAQRTRLNELEAESDTATSSFGMISSKLRVGDSVFSCPGLLALGSVTYDVPTKTYSLRIISGWSYYELGTTLYRRFYLITFDPKGRITEHGLEPMMQTR